MLNAECAHRRGAPFRSRLIEETESVALPPLQRQGVVPELRCRKQVDSRGALF